MEYSILVNRRTNLMVIADCNKARPWPVESATLEGVKAATEHWGMTVEVVSDLGGDVLGLVGVTAPITNLAWDKHPTGSDVCDWCDVDMMPEDLEWITCPHDHSICIDCCVSCSDD